MALDTRGLMQGAAQGFNMMDQYYKGQEKSERADQRLEMQKDTHQRQQEAFEMKKDQNQRAQEMQQAQFTLSKIANGWDFSELSQEEQQFLRDNPTYTKILDPATDKDVENAQRVIDPNDPMDANDPEALGSMNNLFGHRINRGSGGNKKIAGIFPGSQKGKVAIDLEVEGEDGQRYNAPMTRNRGTESDGDDEVLETPVEELTNKVQGYRMARQPFQSPKAQENASKVLAAITGEQPERTRGIKINGNLVNPETGEVMASFSDQGEGSAEWRKLSDGRLYNQRTGETKDAPGANQIGPRTEYQLDRLSGELDHLWQMERRIRTGATGDFGELGVVTKGNSDEVLADVRTRIERNQKQMNKLLSTNGSQRNPRQGTSGSESATGSGPSNPESLIDLAQKVPEQDRDEFIADVRRHPNANEDLIRKIQQQWGSSSQSAQQVEQNQRQGGPAAEQKRQQPETSQVQPDGGESQQRSMSVLNQVLQPDSSDTGQKGIQIPMRPGADESSEEQPSPLTGRGIGGTGGDNFFNRMVGNAIETVRKYPSQKRKQMSQEAMQEMNRIAKQGAPETDREVNRFFLDYAPFINQASPEVRQKMIQIFGREKIMPYLERGEASNG